MRRRSAQRPAGLVSALLLCIVPFAAGPALGFWRWSHLCTGYAHDHGLTVVANLWWHKTGGCRLADASGARVEPHFGVADHLTTVGLVVVGWVVAAGVCIAVWTAVVAIRARPRAGS